MNAFHGKLKEVARRNKCFRGCLIGVYVVLYTLRALGREFWRGRKRLAACVVVFALCSSRLGLAIAYAEEAGVSGNNAVSTENAENSAETAEEQKKENPENGENKQDGTESPEEIAGATGTEDVPAGDVPSDENKDEKNPGNGESGSSEAKTLEENEAPGENTEQENPSVSGSESKDSEGKTPTDESVSDGDAGSATPTVSGDDSKADRPVDESVSDGDAATPTASGNDVSGSDPNGEEGKTEEDTASGEASVSENAPTVSENHPAVSGNDPAVSGNDPAVSNNDPAVSENDPTVSENDVTVSENDPVYVPLLAITYRMTDGPAGVKVGDASASLNVSTAPSYIEPGEDGTAGVSPAACVRADLYGEMQQIDLAETGMADIAFPEDFYGAITFTAEDELGNTYTETTPTLLVDTKAPTATLSETTLEDGARQVRATFGENGYTATGIAGVRCFIDGVEIGLDGYTPETIFENCFGQGVISGASMPLEADVAGRHTVRLEVWDYAGNVSSCEQEVDLPAKRGPISVAISGGGSLTITPWDREEQIYSDEFTLENRSGYDIIATLAYVNVSVNHGILPKDCSLFLSGDVFEAIALPEGESAKLIRVRIPAKREDGETNGSVTMRLHGNVSAGSEELWEDGDVKVKMCFDYEAAPIE